MVISRANPTRDCWTRDPVLGEASGTGFRVKRRKEKMWREMTKQDVAAYLNQDEIDMYCQLPDFKSQADPIGDLLKIVAAKVRGKCRLNGKVRIDANHRYTIPETLLDSAMKMVRYRILTRLPMEVIEDRRNENQAAERELDDVAEGRGTTTES